MKTLSRSNLAEIMIICLIGVACAASLGHADEKGKPTINAALLSEFDVSQYIKPVPRPKDALSLKPRSIPGYEQLSSALWSGGLNGPAALLANGADPNAKSNEGEPILHYAVWLNQYEKLRMCCVPVQRRYDREQSRGAVLRWDALMSCLSQRIEEQAFLFVRRTNYAEMGVLINKYDSIVAGSLCFHECLTKCGIPVDDWLREDGKKGHRRLHSSGT